MAALPLGRYLFNVGSVFAIPPGSNVEPVKFGVLKAMALDVAADQAELRGENWTVEDVQRKNLKISGKLQFQHISPELLLAAWPASAKTTAGRKHATHSATIPGTPFAITVTESATFVRDLGVTNKTTGMQMECVASAPATGQYTVAAGVYTFYAAEGDVDIRYAHTAVAGDLVTVTNAIVEAQTTYYEIETSVIGKGGKQIVIMLPRVSIPGLSIPLALQDFASFDLAFTAMPDANGVPLKVYFNA